MQEISLFSFENFLHFQCWSLFKKVRMIYTKEGMIYDAVEVSVKYILINTDVHHHLVDFVHG